MQKLENSSSIDVLKDFFGEMHRWESKYYSKLRPLLESDAPQDDVDAVQEEAKNVLASIYDRFGIIGKKNRNRIDGLSLSDPPAYESAPNILEKAENDDGTAIYTVKKLFGLQGQYRYTVKKRGDNWILAKREFLDHEQKWRPFAF